MKPFSEQLLTTFYSEHLQGNGNGILDICCGRPDIVRGEFSVMWRNFRCGDILDVEKFWMWRNFTCGDILDVEKFV